MISALLMYRRFRLAVHYAMRDEDFGPILGAGGLLVGVGTLAYSLGNGWSLIDGLYFSVATLTTSNVADPTLVLDSAWMKIFTVLYVLTGIGILVEILRRFGRGFVEARHEQREH